MGFSSRSTLSGNCRDGGKFMKDGLKVIIVIILFVLAGVFIFVGARVHVFCLPVSVGVLWLAMRNLLRLLGENDR